MIGSVLNIIFYQESNTVFKSTTFFFLFWFPSCLKVLFLLLHKIKALLSPSKLTCGFTQQ